MFVLMMIVAGMAIALAIYFLLTGLFAVEPQMQVDTVQRYGVIFSVFVFAVCGPVLVLKLYFENDVDDDDQSAFLGFIVTGAIAAFWSGTLGVVATHSVSAAIAPVIATL